MKSKKARIFEIIILLIATFILSLVLYIRFEFGNAKFEQLLYSLIYSEGTGSSVIIDGILYCLPLTIITFICLFIFTIDFKRIIIIKLKFRNKKYNFQLAPIKHYLIYSFIVLLLSVLTSLYSIGFYSYVINIYKESNIYEKYYVNPNEVNLEFPKEKQNLIYIIMESMESTFDDFNIAKKDDNIIPNLKKIAEDNINFSNTNEFGGALGLYGTGWTIAGMVAQTSGIPLKLDIDGNSYGTNGSFLPGITSLGDILAKEGYNQYLMIGSDATFGGRKSYFKEHGNYKIYDYNWAIKNGKINENYYLNWGFEDKKLFEFAKNELKNISTKSQPFNFTLLTIDTHAPDGYLDESCKDKYNYNYANAVACSDSMVSNFVKWIKKQSFYNNTTIILVGDHLTMQGDITDYVDANERTIYNTIINSRVLNNNTKKREFSSLDLFPTTLASLGVKIEGERLGLGVNLFSNEKTLIEQLGYDYFNNELSKKSTYYNKNFLEKTYYEMINK